eukprot:5678264-Amphidinium_carterae.1
MLGKNVISREVYEELWARELDEADSNTNVDHEVWRDGNPCEVSEPFEDSWSWVSCSSHCGEDKVASGRNAGRRATRWERALVLANRVALEYSKTVQVQGSESAKAAKSMKKSASRPQRRPELSSAKSLPAKSLTGKPQDGLSAEHQEALGFADQ